MNIFHGSVNPGQRNVQALIALAENLKEGDNPRLDQVAKIGGLPDVTIYRDSIYLRWSLHPEVWDGELTLRIDMDGPRWSGEWHYSCDQGGAI